MDKIEDDFVGPWNPPEPKQDYAIVEYKDRAFMLLDSNGKPIPQKPPRVLRRSEPYGRDSLGLSCFDRVRREANEPTEFLSPGGWMVFGVCIFNAVMLGIMIYQWWYT